MDTYRKVKRTNLMLMGELTSLIRELKEERSKCSNQGEELVEVFKTPRLQKRSRDSPHHKELFQTCQEAKSQVLMVSSPGVDLSVEALCPPQLPGCIHLPWPPSESCWSLWIQESPPLTCRSPTSMCWMQEWAPSWLLSPSLKNIGLSGPNQETKDFLFV